MIKNNINCLNCSSCSFYYHILYLSPIYGIDIGYGNKWNNENISQDKFEKTNKIERNEYKMMNENIIVIIATIGVTIMLIYFYYRFKEWR